jgi:phage replication-related protein YjqB (UPF0714/DUF867 family)
MTELLARLPARDNYDLQIDHSRRSKVKIFAPHGGCIEPCTAQIVLPLALDRFDFFLFNGMMKKDCFSTLHVTSTHYDEPQCLQLAREAVVAIAVHGCEGEEPFIQLGGGNGTLAANLREYLIVLGYRIMHSSGELKGEHADNFVNFAQQGGIQLELSAGFRRQMFPGFPRSLQRDPVEFPRFIGAMRSWMESTERSITAALD